MKPRVAFFDFASCEGCQLQIVNLEAELLDVLSVVDVVEFREAISDRSDNYDIAFVEGSITRQADEERIKKIRERAKLLVAFGACASTGNVNCMKNYGNLEEHRKFVYGDKWKGYDTYEARPIDAVVKVDLKINGCPINAQEFTSIVKSLLLGKQPEIPNYAVCVECKAKENVCFFEKKQICLGPIARAGCGAPCPTEGVPCEACRGFFEAMDMNSFKTTLKEHGVNESGLKYRLRLYNGYSEMAK
jgi:coenzyme F420-reducing hydrogenase gamma subunit